MYLLQYEKQAMLPDPESGAPRKPKSDSILSLISRIFLQSFTLTFLAEWGDRSQLTTIILGAREVNTYNLGIKTCFKKNIFVGCIWGYNWGNFGAFDLYGVGCIRR